MSAPMGQEEYDRDSRIFERGRAAGLGEAETVEDIVDVVLLDVDAEIRRALARFPAFNSPHEGKAVIEEELEELWEHVKANTGRSDEARKEAIQVAAMAARYAHDLCDAGPSDG